MSPSSCSSVLTKHQQLHVRGTRHVTIKQRCKYTSSVDIQKRAMKGYGHSFRMTSDKSAVSLLESREKPYIKAVNKSSQSTNVDIAAASRQVKARQIILYSIQRRTWMPHMNDKRIQSACILDLQYKHAITHACHKHYSNIIFYFWKCAVKKTVWHT